MDSSDQVATVIRQQLDAGVSVLFSVFTRPSVKDCRKSLGRDLHLSRRFPQFGGEFDHFTVG